MNYLLNTYFYYYVLVYVHKYFVLKLWHIISLIFNILTTLKSDRVTTVNLNVPKTLMKGAS